jgi:hypothetical protein
MIAALVCVWVPALVPFVPAPEVRAAAEVAELERELTAAGLKTDGVSLQGFFRQRTLSLADQRRLAAAVRRLGDDAFEAREEASRDLTAVGVSGVRFLLPALGDPDLEIARRAARCLEEIRRQGPGPHVAAAAARLLAVRAPSDAVETLLGYVPFADDEYVEEAVLSALAEVGRRGGRSAAAFERAADDVEPARRGAAARVLGLSGDLRQREGAQRLLADPEASVRLQAARVLLIQGDPSAVPSLIGLLTEAPAPCACEAEEMLERVAGPTGPELAFDLTNDAGRRECRAAWEAWWRAHEGAIDLVKAPLESRALGLTLIADLDGGRILEIGRDHKPRWQIAGFGGPVDVQVLSNGRILVAENHARKVTERDRSGRVCWERATSTFPASCQRLPNGNTFIATYNQLVEVTPDGREALQLSRPDGVYNARKLKNGRIVLVNSAGKIATLDPAGKELSSFETGGVASWSSLEILANGHCLACCAGGKVVEFGPGGRPVWECAVPNAVCAARLVNGHTLVGSSEGRRVVEVDRAGKVVWEHRTEGRPWHVLRR